MERLSVLACLLIVCAGAAAQVGPLQLTYLGPDTPSGPPHETITLVFSLENTLSETVSVATTTSLPAGWKPLLPDAEYEVAGGAKEILLISFLVADAAPAGPYPVGLDIRVADSDILPVLHTATVWVTPHVEIVVELLRSPAYVIAGQEFSGDFLLQNRSNTAVSVEIKAVSAEEFPLVVGAGDGGIVSLPRGGSWTIPVTGRSRSDVPKLLRHRTRVTAFVLRQDGSRDPAHKPVVVESFVDVIPKTQIGGDRYHRIPVDVILTQTNEFGPGWDPTATATLAGDGALDEAGRHEIKFVLKKKLDLPPATAIDPADSFRVLYANQWLTLEAGDNGYALSPLVEGYRYGRGGSAEIDLGSFRFGSHYHQSYWLDDPIHYVGGHFDYLLLNTVYPGGFRYRVGLNALGTIDDNIALGVYQQFRPIPPLSLVLEVAGGQSTAEEADFAVLGSGTGDHGWISYALDVAYAGPRFPGFRRDLFSINSGLDLALLGGSLELGTQIGFGRRNLLLSPSASDAPQTWDGRLISRYDLAEIGTEIQLLWSISSRRDRLPTAGYDTLRNGVKLEVEQPIGRLTFTARGDVGFVTDRLGAETSVEQKYTAGLLFSPNKSQDHSLALVYDGELRPSDTSIHQFSWQVGSTIQFPKLDIDFRLLNGYTVAGKSYDGTDLGLTVNLGYALDHFNRLAVRGEYDLSSSPSGTDHSGAIGLQYNGLLMAPIRRKSDVGAVKGVVRNALSGEPLPNVIVRLGAYAAVTNRRGRYLFPAVKPGTHYMDADGSLAGISLVPIIRTPFEVVVESREDVEVNIPMGLLGVVEGVVALYDFAEEADRFDSDDGDDELDESGLLDPDLVIRKHVGSYVPIGTVPSVLVSISNGFESHRRVSNAKGLFVFEDLPPGRWTISLEPAGLPTDTFVTREEFTLELGSGVSEFVRFDVFPKKREIIIIDQGTLSLGPIPTG